LRRTVATKDQVFIADCADCRLSIEEVLWQFPPLSIGPALTGSIENRQFQPGNLLAVRLV
jgi:hypothetical protein